MDDKNQQSLREFIVRKFITQKLKAIKNKLRDLGYRDCYLSMCLIPMKDGIYYHCNNECWEDGDDADQPLDFYGDFGGEDDDE